MTDSQILDVKDIDRIITRISHEITEKKTFNPDTVVLVGIRTRGVFLAQRIQKKINEIEGFDLDVGTLDISFHRDDLNLRDQLPQVGVTNVPFSIDNKIVVLLDDVLYTGRTIRAALDELIDLGRPDRIELAVLIDRGHRELPIKADFVGKNIPTKESDSVKVHLKEIDDRDEVIIKCL